MPGGRRERPEPSGEATGYASSLLSAYSIWRRNAVEREEPVAESARVLFISDGNDRGEDDPAAVARRLGLTVDVLAPPSAPHAGPPPAAPSVRITGVQNPRSMAPEHPDSALILQPVRHRCEAGQTARVRARLRPGRIRGASRIRGVAREAP